MLILKDYWVDKLHVMIFDSRDSMGQKAGADTAKHIKEMLKYKEELNIVFAAAPSQHETLMTLRQTDGIDWTRINAYHMDEYIGLSPDHSASFRNLLNRTLFNQLPFKSINLINGNAEDAFAEARRYGNLLTENPIDICLLGVGENGHLAFNDPPVADFKDSQMAKVVQLEEACRVQQVNDRCFDKLEDVPTQAITVTIPGLTNAKVMICSVPALTKAEAVKNMLNGDVTEQCPASILTTHPGATLYLDKDSAKYLL